MVVYCLFVLFSYPFVGMPASKPIENKQQEDEQPQTGWELTAFTSIQSTRHKTRE
jgi:hypothetical protein